MRALLSLCLVACGVLAAQSVSAQVADTGAANEGEPQAEEEEKLIWRGTTLGWTQSASGQTVGIGQDYQSSNPSYEWTFSLSPKLWLYEDDDQSYKAAGDIGFFREFTNADNTTKRGEFSLTDALLTTGYSRALYEDGDYKTTIGLTTPNLTFPTSKASANSGKILGLGAQLSLGQSIPIQGSEAEALQSANFSAVAGYTHTFTEATVPTNPDLQRVRMDPSGEAIPGDQLRGAAYAKHQASFGFGAGLSIAERISWQNTFSWTPVWKYAFRSDVEVCNVVATGCVTPDRVEDPQDFSVITLFSSGVDVSVMDELSVGINYTNLTLQLGPDGQRRNFFYSPDARLSLTVTANLDEIYKSAKGSASTASAGKADVASR